MIHRISLTLLALTTLSFAQAPKPAARKPSPALAPIEDVAGLPRVLIIGDSISIGYTLPTRELLKGVANVHRIPTNGSSSDAGLKNLDAWLATGGAGKKWDAIHFNWGLHDLKHLKDGKLDLTGPQVNAIDAYAKNLSAIVAKLKTTGAKLIWATTTPVPAGSDGRVPGDEVKYNAAAAGVMKAEGVAIDDLHAVVVAKPDTQREKNVHFTDEGSKALAGQVAAEIRKALGK
ncbi:MAG: SGNH/GDSL hydrolase family protein [Chthoniobacteraceae bacterium]